MFRPEVEDHRRIKDLFTAFRDVVDQYMSKLKAELQPTLLKVSVHNNIIFVSFFMSLCQKYFHIALFLNTVHGA